jgi:SulP family sulfate permease
VTISKLHEFIPKSYLYFRKGYKLATFKKDLAAGLTVGVIALPLAMAFAIASDVGPEKGLYTAIIAGFLTSLLGGSRVQIGGPTGAFVVIVYGIMQRTGYTGLCLSMLIAAVILLLLGIFRLGSWIKYVPHPLVIGFTTGIAVLIFSSQIKDFFGLHMASPPADFLEKWACYFKAFPSFDAVTLSLGAGTLGVILCIRRFAPWLPWGISAIVLSTTVCVLFHLPVDTIQSRFGEIPRNLPLPSLPCLSIPIDKFKEIFTDGLTIAFLGAIESLLSAVIGDGMIGGRHRSNCELVAQGIANFGSVLFGGIPATGAIARTATNVKTGAQTPVAGMLHALVLLLILYCFAPIVSQIPLSALAAVLIMIAWSMSEMGHFIRLLRAPQGDILILLTAFLLTVFIDITVAISAGMILASFMFMKRMSQQSKATPPAQVFQEQNMDFPENTDTENISKKMVPEGVEVYEIQGPFFFGAAHILRDLLHTFALPPKIFILRMRFVPVMDASGMYAIEEFHSQCKKKGVILLLSGVRDSIKKDLIRFGLFHTIGAENIFSHIDTALMRSKKILELSVERSL